MRKIIIVFAFVMTFVTSVSAQQDAQYTQYMYNTITINPAYAGSRGALSIGALHRSQWMGLDGAPKTQTINVNSPITEKVGLGFSVVNDNLGNGTVQETYFDASFSYTLPTGGDGKFTFGLKGGGQLLNINFDKLENYDPTLVMDGSMNIDNKFSPTFGAGFYFHTERLYIGASVPNFLQTDHFDDSGQNTSLLASDRLNYYFMSGYVFDLSEDFKMKPAFLLKAVKGAPLQIDTSANFLMKEKFGFGVGYRWGASLNALISYQISEQFMVGLAYDRETSELGSTQFNDGTFEVFLRYELPTKLNNVLTPRFF